MKISHDLILGVAIGAGVALLIFNISTPPVKTPTLPKQKVPPVLSVGMHPDWYRRRGIPGY